MLAASKVINTTVLLGLLTAACSLTPGDRSTFAKTVRHDRADYDAAPRIGLIARYVLHVTCADDGDGCANLVLVGTSGAHGHTLLALASGPIVEFDSSGNFLRTIGHHGTGLGQYESVSQLSYDGDTTYELLDVTGFEFTTFDTSGHMLRRQSITAQLGISGVAASPNGVVQYVLPPGDSIGASVVARFVGQRAGDDDLHSLASVETRAVTAQGSDMQPMRPFFEPAASWTADRVGNLYFTSGEDDGTVERFGADGKRELLLVSGIPAWPVTKSELTAKKNDVLESFSPEWRTRVIRDVDRAAANASRNHSPITQVAAFEDGSMWLRETPDAAADSARWNVFNADGSWRGWVKLSTRATPLDGGATRVLVADVPPGGHTYAGTATWYVLSK